MADAASFAVLVPRHTAAMLHVAASLVGMDDAEDAAQEAIMRAWQAWPALREESAARSWLIAITVNVCRQWRRGAYGRHARMTRPLPQNEETGEELLALLHADPGASDHLGSLDLRAAVNQLRPELRLVVALRYYAGLDATEIGAALGIPPATARTRLRRALELLRTHLRISGEGASVRARLLPQGGSHVG
jgi:RNA polymerase sigma-70 factor, ECF subfamily